MKRITKLTSILLIVAQLFFGLSLTAFADSENEEGPVGAPEVMIINGPTYDVNPGESNEVELLLRNTGAYKASGISVTTELTDVSQNPFAISFKNKENQIAEISPRGERKLKLYVDVDKNAPSKSYALNIKYVYFNRVSDKFERTDTIYLRVKNGSGTPSYQLENISLSPSSLSPGENGTLSIKVFNQGPLDLYDLNINLTDLDPQGISTVGISNMKVGKFYAGTEKTITFKLVANPEMKSGSYPVSLKFNYTDLSGNKFEDVHTYYVSVGGAGALGTPTLEISNLVEPAGTYGINQNFNINFNLKNLGESSAKNVKVTVNPSEGIVPKSTSVKTFKEFAAGATAPIQFTLAATSAAPTKNHSIEIRVEYGKSNIETFSQYVGVNITNPDKGPDGESKASKPKIIVSKYVADPLIVLAGEEFDLNMTLLNTHINKSVKNIKTFLTLSEETSTDSAKTGNIFTPVDSSNTFYFDRIPAKGTVNKKIRLYTVPDAQPKTYTLKVNFEYEDETGNEYTATELLGINVQQPTKIETSDIYVPETLEMGMPVNVSFDLYNTGRVQVSNLMISLEGDIEAATKSTYYGNFDAGNSENFDGNFSFTEPGNKKFTLKISYDDPSGETFEIRKDFNVEVTEPVAPEGELGPDGEPLNPEGEGGSGMGKKIGIVIAIIIVVGVAAFIIKKKHDEKKEEAFLKGDDEDGNENIENEVITEDSDEKGNDADEQP